MKNVTLCSPNLNGGTYAIHVFNNGPGRCENWTQAHLDEFGLKLDPAYGNNMSEATDYNWKQTVESDTIVIEKPSVYVFSVSEREKCGNIYDASGFGLAHSMILQDITNNKSYTLSSLASSTQKTYDYGNVKIRCIKKLVNSTSGTGTYDRSNKSTYMIYLDPGEYKLIASGSAGNGTIKGGASIYTMSMSSPSLSTSYLAAPVVNNVKHTAFGGTLYELIPIENGQEFDYSTMYTNETKTDIYV